MFALAVTSLDRIHRPACALLALFLAITVGCNSESASTAIRSLHYVVTPSVNARSGIPLEQQPVVRIGNGEGGFVRRAGVVVTVTVDSGNGTVSSGATATTDSNGVATFGGLTLHGIIGGYMIVFSTSPAVTLGSGEIQLRAGLATALGVIRQPSPSAASGVPFLRQPVVQLYDDAGNVVLQTDVAVTAALAIGGPAQLGGVLTMLTSETGTATFGTLAITGAAGAQRLAFSAPGAGTVISDSVVVTP